MIVAVVVVTVMRMAPVVMVVEMVIGDGMTHDGGYKLKVSETQVLRRRRGRWINQGRPGGEVHQVPQGSLSGQTHLLLC